MTVVGEEIEKEEDIENDLIHFGNPIHEKEDEGKSAESTLEDDFDNFEKSHSNNNPEDRRQEEKDENDIFEENISSADDFKLKIFMSLMFALLDGMHVFIYGFISKYKLVKEDIALDESDRDALQIYFRTPRVMNMINRLPVEVIGFVHMEYLYFTKFQDFNKRMKEEEDSRETEDVEYEEVKDQPPKKRGPYKKNAKKKPKKNPVKKSAPENSEDKKKE